MSLALPVIDRNRDSEERMLNCTLSGPNLETIHAAEPALLLDSTVTVMESLIGCDLAGEQVILDLKSGVYYGLDLVGSRIWQLIQTPTSVRKVRDTILEEYDVDAERCERDLLALLQELASRELIEVKMTND
jgi:hypothetical protein